MDVKHPITPFGKKKEALRLLYVRRAEDIAAVVLIEAHRPVKFIVPPSADEVPFVINLAAGDPVVSQEVVGKIVNFRHGFYPPLFFLSVP